MSYDRLQEPQPRISEPKFDMDEFEDILQSINNNDRNVTIKYESYEYEGAIRIVKLKVDLNNILPCFFEYLEEQVIECLALRLNKINIVLETKIEFI